MTEQEQMQEYFNIMVRGLRSQGWLRSKRMFWFSAYRGINMRKCAIGWLIPDQEYNPDMEGHGWHHVSAGPMRGVPATSTMGEFFYEAQDAHDLAGSPRLMETRFRNIAADFGLNFPEDESGGE